ncbi:MAG TPA: hypothetical protein VET24_07610, partial [Actinomycetota bacterium]|nr:hypothetical protein [Actinomycetota bacterium]
IATQLAARLGITRVISTDAIREVLRAAFSQKLIPTLYVSSFNADEALRVPISSPSEQLIVGFQEQVTAVSVGIKALIARALEEGTDIIVEGAHVVPGFLEGWEEEFDQAVLVPVVIAVSDVEMHRSHFAMRALETRSRPRDRYLTHFEKIRALQDYIVGLAGRAGAPVVEMFDLDSTLQQIAAIVVAKALEKAQARTEVEPLVAAAGSEPDAAVGGVGNGVGGTSRVRTTTKVPRLKSWELLAGRRKG